MAALAIPLITSLATQAILPVGFSALGMSAAGWGWAIGSMAASYLLAPDSEGPRLSDLAAGGSSYGVPIPLCYGTTKVSGNVIWASDLIETKHEESAKGGPEYTSYTYAQHLAVMVCAGPVTGIRKIWANGKLILDASDTNTGETGQTSNIRIYVGDESQVADSLLETEIGAGLVPAHRGYCYVVFENLQLADYGNRSPSFEFEVVSVGSFSRITPEVLFNGEAEAPYFIDSANGLIHVVDQAVSRSIINVYDINTRAWVSTYSITADSYQLWPGPMNTFFSWSTSVTYQFERLTGRLLESWSTPGSSVGAYRAYDSTFVFCYSGQLYKLQEGAGVAELITSFSGSTTWQVVTIAGENIVLYSDYHKRIAVVDWANEVRLDASTGTPTGSATWPETCTYDSTRNKVYCTDSNTTTIHVVDLDAMTLTSTNIPAGDFVWPSYMPGLDVIATITGGTIPTIHLLDPDTLAIQDTWGADPYWPADNLHGKFYTDPHSTDRVVLIGATASSQMAATLVTMGERITAAQIALSSIVSDLCERAGLEAADYDVTDLTDMVDGYKTT